MQLAEIWGNPREALPCSYHPKFGLSTVVRCLSKPPAERSAERLRMTFATRQGGLIAHPKPNAVVVLTGVWSVARRMITLALANIGQRQCA